MQKVLTLAADQADGRRVYPLRTAAISSLVALSCVVCRRSAEPSGALARTMDHVGAGKREEMLQI